MATEGWLANLSRALKDNSPSILSGIAITGVVGTAVLAVRGTPKATERLEDLNAACAVDEITPNLRMKLDATWKCYIPAGMAGAATIACIVAANTIGSRRQAATVAAYTLMDRAYREYKDQVVKELGENKERKIHDDLQQKRIEENPASSSQIIFTGKGEHLCWDSFSGRYFESDIESIRKAGNDVNEQILSDMYASQNDFYALIGLEPILAGEELGWNLENLIKLVFSSHLSDIGRPCLAIGYEKPPIREYTKF